ncbi:PBSX family phage terminase large subunit [Lactococcus lactis]|uniref:PBSX family phage terminase large subunit n=1 Tax=Lactococcus lactis TaxID=1358 RepID=A0A6B3RTJ2_9LACT|nr:PBSX family phage terminase large subunit [Lactococcus lactis]MCT1174156.1 PBSX family phage terminase large subunit [Lactococcus lactis]MCT1186499.1 PBSX family phage terminase large subunit [Lactococcus lactis]MCT1189555.1 PBSX family phage terminase large subunit [Lactococcus lactis]MCT1195269.1 PBSX family phage terminase large subunit [Lactococcus lactis]NEX49357.1 PBSX family phage terminase large subunit [Lactococcus lactis]
MRIKRAAFKFKLFSKKQNQIMKWWTDSSPYKDKEILICDGSVRAGKTVVMSISFIFWAMFRFNEQQFIFAGKTIGSLRRNVIRPLKTILESCKGFKVVERRTENLLVVQYKGHTNYFFMFGGKDEGSQDLVQGLTAAGAFYDEVALMPESFVNQAQARLSVEGAKSWFNCNPAGPFHWFKKRFIDNAESMNALHIHFLMRDNPSLSKQVLERYARMFTGVFYKRYILGLWVMSEGVIFDNFDRDIMVAELPNDVVVKRWYISIDYGTQNPTVFLLWAQASNGKSYLVREYYYSGREKGKQKTDSEFADDLMKFIEDLPQRTISVVVDPSAASFIAELKQRKWNIKRAKNDVLDGIRFTQTAMNENKIKFSSKCEKLFEEFGSYVWDDKAAEHGEDKPVKEHDHAMDAMRYYCYTVLAKGSGVSVLK